MNSRRRLGAFVVAVALVGACSGGGDDANKVTAADSDETTTTSGLGLDETTTTLVDSAATGNGSSATTAKGTSATTAKPSGSSGTTAKPATSAPAANPNAAPGPAKTGTYTYAQSGSGPDGPVPPSGTLEVAGGATQTFSRYYDTTKAPQRLTYAFRDNGPHITAASMNFKGATASCNFGNGVPAPPWPPTPGSSFSGAGTCTTPIGAMTATISVSVASRAGDIVHLTATVNVKNANGSVNVTLNDVEEWSISLRVPKKSRQTFSGAAFGSPISGDVTSTLTGTP